MELVSSRVIDWSLDVPPTGITSQRVHFGNGAQPIQVGLASSDSAPSRSILRTLYQDRKGRLPIFVIIAVSHGDSVSIYGPDPDSETIVLKLATAQAVLNSILEQESEISAYQRAVFLWRSKQTTDMVGFTNNGLFASHFIRTSIDRHAKWGDAQKRSIEIQHLRDKELITGLGFEISASPSSTLLLSANGQEKRVVAILLDRTENFDAKSPRLQASPVEWSLGIAAQQGAPWVIAIKDSQLRLYPARDGVGVGQKSQAETYFEIDLLTVDEDKVGLLSLIFSAEALAEDGAAEGLLNDSKKFAAELGVRLRERVYEQVVPSLATEIANQLRAKGHELDTKGLQLSYELTLRVLFRLLFQAYAEDRGLLPAGRNEIFDSNSMKRWAEHLLSREPNIPFGDSSTIWFDLMQVWDAIDQGNPEMQIPAYNGGLFGSDPDLNPTGSIIRALSIPDRVMGPALRALVVDEITEDGVPGAVDFRSLSVREFGTIYEGLLESSLSVAHQDLTVDSKGAWVPAKESDQILARENEVYFQSASGERKATGSYYTPSFIVDHLIERSVEPALNDHLAKVKELIGSGDQAAAYKLFFDFRVADLAMGSAHFLVAAIDKIESIMRSFLVQPYNNIEGVNAELIRLEEAAKTALGRDEAAYAEIERASLLRRQIARRCIYGLDINPLAVELSRLAIWIHTFVPGLPMSSLEHNLVCANSLTGIGSVDEGLNALIPERAKGQSTLFDGIVEQSLNEAKVLLEEVANADEADKKQSLEAAEAAKQARQAATKSKMIFDLAVANRNGVVSSGAAITETDLEELYSNHGVKELVDSLRPAHMPYLFPEVFLRDNPGFDSLVGNPPWEEVMLEEPRFWLRVRPGLYGLKPQEMATELERLRGEYPHLVEQLQLEQKSVANIRSTLISGPFPGLGKGDVDLYKVFSWRNWQLLRRNGRTGLVVPKSLVSSAGSFEWRQQVFENSRCELTYLINTGRWVFEAVHAQYSIVLMSLSKQEKLSDYPLKINGLFHSLEGFDDGKLDFGELPISIVKQFSRNYSVPVLSDFESIEVFRVFGSGERLDSTTNFSFVPVTEFHATNDRKVFDTGSRGDTSSWPVIGGSGFNIWEPQPSEVYAYAVADPALSYLLSKRENQARNSRSAFNRLSPEVIKDPKKLEALHPRVAFRDVTNSVDYRTVIAALIPSKTFLTNSAPYLLRVRGTIEDEAFILGVLCSLPLDWIARKFVVLHLNFHILNSLPIPRLSPQDSRFRRIVAVVGGLISFARTSPEWVSQLSQAPISIRNKPEREAAIAELDALVASAYGLEEKHLHHIFRTFHKTWDYTQRLADAIEYLRGIDIE